MKEYISIAPELKTIIPKFQLLATIETPESYTVALEKLYHQLIKCPKIGETDGIKEHPTIFHYFFGGHDFYICEYEPKIGRMFGFSVCIADLENSGWGYFHVSEFSQSKYLNIDYHFQEQSIEAALYTAYPKYYKKPQSLTE